MSRQDSESENEEGLLSQTQSRDTVTDIGSPFSTSEPSIEPEGQGSGGTEDNYHRNMSWLHITILLCNQQSFICTHIDFCHPRCHSRSCARLVRAIEPVYGETVDSLREDSTFSSNIGARPKKSKECSDKSCLRTPSTKRRPNDPNTEGKKDTGNRALDQIFLHSCFHPGDEFGSSSSFAADRSGSHPTRRHVRRHPARGVGAPAQRGRTYGSSCCCHVSPVLWRFRYQVWPRMEEGAQQIFKILPPSINSTLPSPILGMPCVPIFDPPWVPQNTGSVQDPINEDQSGCRGCTGSLEVAGLILISDSYF
ncbi:protein unc-80 homolog [Notolabrus celidotus]|uniref:protein unc-80 homolog n=1 Tax=Notolabrus celidotus TaxID=1203425 RepID=UPI001490559F|nr:protein unc-80 homolog [Notolabrus celidotus]